MSFVIDAVVGMFSSINVLMLVCQVVFVTWSLVLSVGYMYVFRSWSAPLSDARNNSSIYRKSVSPSSTDRWRSRRASSWCSASPSRWPWRRPCSASCTPACRCTPWSSSTACWRSSPNRGPGGRCSSRWGSSSSACVSRWVTSRHSHSGTSRREANCRASTYSTSFLAIDCVPLNRARTAASRRAGLPTSSKPSTRRPQWRQLMDRASERRWT